MINIVDKKIFAEFTHQFEGRGGDQCSRSDSNIHFIQIFCRGPRVVVGPRGDIFKITTQPTNMIGYAGLAIKSDKGSDVVLGRESVMIKSNTELKIFIKGVLKT